MVSFLLLKDYSTSNLHIRTSIIIPGCKALSTKNIFKVLIGISDMNSDILEGPWPYEKSTKNTELTLRCKWKPKILHWEHIFKMDKL